jgi:hypothetical protein
MSYQTCCDALKDATLAQLGNAESYLQDEYDEIQKALEIEEALQEIKDSDTDAYQTCCDTDNYFCLDFQNCH